MKAAAFDYSRPDSLGEVLELLAQHGDEAKLIAGGQSLVPMMAMRLTRPALLVDINRLQELKSLQRGADSVVMGAGTRQRAVEDDTELHAQLPLVKCALAWIGHTQTRNRGTVGGSLVHADPSAELPLAALILDAQLRFKSAEVERVLPIDKFFLGPMFSDTAATECLTAIEWPVWQKQGTGAAFDEVAIRHGDFALASAAAQVQLDAAGVCRRASFGAGGVDGVPRVFPGVAERLIGQRLDDDDLLRGVATDAAAQCEPGNDPHASAQYRRHLATILIARVLRQAAQAATASFESRK
ncbi:MAG TPA: FAD binding domain-containing protein [Burkholderiales bacterium]|jgi:CO/xanthine dehydrogenase FAD-binding subunit|nr:FAD binding domain-containing protein [Burkholderiales bacterium]